MEDPVVFLFRGKGSTRRDIICPILSIRWSKDYGGLCIVVATYLPSCAAVAVALVLEVGDVLHHPVVHLHKHQPVTHSLTYTVIDAPRSLTHRILTHSITYSTNLPPYLPNSFKQFHSHIVTQVNQLVTKSLTDSLSN